MEDATSPGALRSERTDRLVRALGRERGEIEQFLAAQRERLRSAHASLAAQLERIARELARAKAESQQVEGDLASRSRRLDEETEALSRLREEILAAQAAWQASQDRAAQQQSQWAEQIQRQQDQLRERLEELSRRHAEIGQAKAELASERRELELARQESESASRQRGETEARQLAELRQALAEATSRREELQNELTAARRRCQELEAAPAEKPSSAETDEGLSRLGQERDDLAGLLVEAREEIARLRKQVEEAPARASSGAEDYQRRYAMAMEDLRELKRRNAELESQLAQPRAGGAAGAPPAGPMDWEAQKQRILAALEADLDEDNAEDAQQRIKIEEVLQMTQRTIEDRDREVAELKQLLEAQSSQVGQVAVGAAAFAEIIDQDAIIQEERENLRRRQDELREKLRQAEVEISIERAKIARERVELEEKSRRLGLDKAAETTANPEHEKPARGRWLSRLGLKDEKGPAGDGGG